MSFRRRRIQTIQRTTAGTAEKAIVSKDVGFVVRITLYSVAEVYNTLCLEDKITDDQETEEDSANLALVNRTNKLYFVLHSLDPSYKLL
jgi:hypothetical protein